MIKRVFAATSATACAVVLSGCIMMSGDAPAPSGSDTITVTPATTSRPVTRGVVREKLSAGPWTVTVEDAVRSGQSVGGANPAAGHDFVLVTVGFENQGTDALDVRPQDFSLADASGNTMPQASTSQVMYNAGEMRPLPPAMGTSTVFVFQVPKGSDRYAFVFSPPGQNTKLEWQVP